MLAFADDDLGAAAADVGDQAPPGFAGHRVRDAEINQARFFDTGDDFDGMAERRARAIQERAFALGLAERVGADDANALGLHVAQPLAESLQACERNVDGLALQAALFVQTGAEPHALAQAILDDELPVRMTGNDHVKTVGTEIDRRNDVGNFARHCQAHPTYRLQFFDTGIRSTSHFDSGTVPLTAKSSNLPTSSDQVLNDEPQPQVVVAFGLRMTNCAPSMSSL